MLVAPRAKNWGRALGREHLDVMLRDAAVEAGAALLQPGEIVDLQPDGESTRCRTAEGAEIEARIVIAACGSWNAKGVFALRDDPPSPSDLFAFKAHFTKADLPAGLMPLLAFPGGYGGLVHSDGGRVSLSCCVRRDVLAAVRARYPGKAGEAVLAHIQETTKGAWQALNQAVLEDSVLSTGPIRPGIRPRYRDGIYFTGNMAGEAHPVIAEGISMAIQSSGLLARLLLAGQGGAYAQQWRRHFAPRIGAASLFAHLAMSDAGRTAGLAVLRAAPGLLDLGARLSGKRPLAA
jgi:flavin-dependent dehydrogenase